MTENDEKIAIWFAAESARRVALRAAIRDKTLWGVQIVYVICGLIKAFCVAMAVSICFQRSGLPESFCHAIAVLVTGPLLVFNPRAFFWRNLFSERADAAFVEALRDYDRSWEK
ncbi:hypothetical protein KBJ94_23635 [Pseudomonas sp. ITA]|uniref:hypothetical protein n=1 Tax=Pseudomonas sp. ITA TaxID=2825841 RepID=UPI0024995E09|nr:hypothetical protein [Pseudomonas sp. ITA]MDI2145043.1 hypothetical protein [Pseudomonas sp. ITA]